MYKVRGIFRIGNNSAVAVEGNGNGLKNGCYITNEAGKCFHVLSIALKHDPNSFDKETELLVEGRFEGNIIRSC